MGRYPHLGEIFFEGLHRDRHRVVDALRVKALLITRRGLRAHVKALRSTADAESLEVRDL